MAHIQSEVRIHYQSGAEFKSREHLEMHTVLILSGGRRLDALLLSASPDRLRMVIPGRPDAVELQMIEGRWVFEHGVRVEFGALMIADGMSPARFVPQTHVRALAAV
jgi:hypothetical protein